MLGLVRNLLSIGQGLGGHNPSYDICICFSVWPTGSLCKAARGILMEAGGRDGVLSDHFKNSAPDTGEHLQEICHALGVFSPLLQEHEWVVSLTGRFVGNPRKRVVKEGILCF